MTKLCVTELLFPELFVTELFVTELLVTAHLLVKSPAHSWSILALGEGRGS